MNYLFQPKRFTRNMPPTPVTDEMRSQLVALAKQENVSLAQVQRTAYEILLRLVSIIRLSDPDTTQVSTNNDIQHEKVKAYMELLKM